LLPLGPCAAAIRRAMAPARLQGLREMDALIAYLQMLGTGLDAQGAAAATHEGH